MNEHTIKLFMYGQLQNCIDEYTGEFSVPLLAEIACEHCNDFSEDGDIKDTYFKCAIEVVETVKSDMKNTQASEIDSIEFMIENSILQPEDI